MIVFQTEADILVIKHVVVLQPEMLGTVPLRTRLRILQATPVTNTFVEVYTGNRRVKTYDVYHVIRDEK